MVAFNTTVCKSPPVTVVVSVPELNISTELEFLITIVKLEPIAAVGNISTDEMVALDDNTSKKDLCVPITMVEDEGVPMLAGSKGPTFDAMRPLLAPT